MNLTETEQYKRLSNLPQKISSLESKLKKTRTEYNEALNAKDEANRDLDKAYKAGNSSEIDEAKKAARNATNTVEALQEQIQDANKELEEANKQLQEVSADYRKIVVKQANKVLKKFLPVVEEMDELNAELKEMCKCVSFGSLSKKHRVAPPVPSLSISKQTEKLKKKIQSWDSATGK
ncbi:hypothetical protein [Rhodohalobacter halophilus]|uniref:hypothetical protein n=1 Tax=Rhodohalobacter halophilus TaxID=1812810 RepID=UPI00083FD1D5|nr:hypothetical protein [Rhodohalobacter halophilus]